MRKGSCVNPPGANVCGHVVGEPSLPARRAGLSLAAVVVAAAAAVTGCNSDPLALPGWGSQLDLVAPIDGARGFDLPQFDLYRNDGRDLGPGFDLAGCNVGWKDCDGDAANGCEVNTSSDPRNCGACGIACPVGKGCAAGACVGQIRALLVHSDGTLAMDLPGKLLGTGSFAAVDLVDAQLVTPSLVDLGKYDAVLVWGDNPFRDGVKLGDNLADYYDGGGSVVLAQFAIGGLPIAWLRGRFGNPANG